MTVRTKKLLGQRDDKTNESKSLLRSLQSISFGHNILIHFEPGKFPVKNVRIANSMGFRKNTFSKKLKAILFTPRITANSAAILIIIHFKLCVFQIMIY